MSINNICLNTIPYDISEISDQNEAINLNKSISFIDGWMVPFIFEMKLINSTVMCGPLVKIVEILGKKLDFK